MNGTVKKKKLVISDLMTPQEFASRLQIDRERVFKWIQRGHITVYQMGSDENPRYLIKEGELAVAAEFMKKHTR